jgi:PAS domain S-box-containing protein
MLSSYPVACPHAKCGWTGGLVPSLLRGGADAEIASTHEAWFRCPRCQGDWEVRIADDRVTVLPAVERGRAFRDSASSKPARAIAFDVDAASLREALPGWESPTHPSAMVSPESRQANQVPQEERFRLLVQGVTDYAIFLLDTAAQVTCWNTGGKLMFGYQETEIIGQHYSRFFTPQDIQSGEPEKDLKASAAEGTARAVRWHVRADGTRFWCHDTISAVREHDGTLLGFATVVRDLSGQPWPTLARTR